MDGLELESSSRRRWHYISGLTVCAGLYLVSLTLLKLFVLG
jgi:hypothetical protein